MARSADLASPTESPITNHQSPFFDTLARTRIGQRRIRPMKPDPSQRGTETAEKMRYKGLRLASIHTPMQEEEQEEEEEEI